MIWTPEQVFAVERLHTQCTVSREAVYRAGEDLMAYTREKVARELIEYAHPLGVELNPEDIAFRVTHDPQWDASLVMGRWEPKTTDGLLMGGPADGTVYAVPRAAHRWIVRVIQQQGPEYMGRPIPLTEAMLETTVLDYMWTGWHEERRVWTYEQLAK